jgi:DMSO/TMAO reductase YedYZ heme-binding membrane subunit
MLEKLTYIFAHLIIIHYLFHTHFKAIKPDQSKIICFQIRHQKIHTKN